MVLGLSRMQPRSPRPPIAPLPPETAPQSTQETDWLAQRGAILFEATCDLMGGFPGFADYGGEVSGALLRISERFLIVDEGRPHGFGIPVAWLDGVALAAQEGREDADLRVFLFDGAFPRCFSLRFRTSRLSMRGGKRAERARDALQAAGLIGSAPPDAPDFVLPWEQTGEFDSENVLWTGHASAPVRVGQELAPSEIWLSTQSLIWGSSEGIGLNRVPVADLRDVISARLKDREGAPAVYLAVSGECFGRFEIPFVFDQQETPDGNFRERGAFMAGLRSRAIPEGDPTPLWQPWRLDVHPATRQMEPIAEIEPNGPPATEPEPLGDGTGVRARIESWLPKLHSLATRGLALPSAGDEQATVVAFEPAASSTTEAPASESGEASAPVILNGAEETLDETDLSMSSPLAEVEGQAVCADPENEPAIESHENTDPAENLLPSVVPGEERALDAEKPSSVSLPDQDHRTAEDPPITRAQRFETAALGVLADALQAIDIRLETGSLEPLSRLASLAPLRDAAFTEIRELGAHKTIKKRELRGDIARLTNLHGAGVRLRSIVDLYDRGLLDNRELAFLRTKLVSTVELSPDIVPLATPARETGAVSEAFFGV